jgi:hypothetical protein
MRPSISRIKHRARVKAPEFSKIPTKLLNTYHMNSILSQTILNAAHGCPIEYFEKDGPELAFIKFHDELNKRRDGKVLHSQGIL